MQKLLIFLLCAQLAEASGSAKPASLDPDEPKPSTAAAAAPAVPHEIMVIAKPNVGREKYGNWQRKFPRIIFTNPLGSPLLAKQLKDNPQQASIVFDAPGNVAEQFVYGLNNVHLRTHKFKGKPLTEDERSAVMSSLRLNILLNPAEPKFVKTAELANFWEAELLLAAMMKKLAVNLSTLAEDAKQTNREYLESIGLHTDLWPMLAEQYFLESKGKKDIDEELGVLDQVKIPWERLVANGVLMKGFTPDSLPNDVRIGLRRVVRALLKVPGIVLSPVLIKKAIMAAQPVAMVDLLLKYKTPVDAAALFGAAGWPRLSNTDREAIVKQLIAAGASVQEAMKLAQAANNEIAKKALEPYVTAQSAAAAKK